MQAKKSFGQHFLTNHDIARRIANALSIDQEGDTSRENRARVLEVGPGKGMLTTYLLEKDIDLRVVEADRDMVEYLQRHFEDLDGKIIARNFLKLDLAEVFGPEEEFFLIGNFPYNISSQIVFKMLQDHERIPEMVGMFQKEMAERIIAGPGGKDYGVISVLTQAYYKGKYLFSVGNRNFAPPPKVQSAVIRLTRKEEQPDCDYKLFRRVVKQAFSQRRKMLRNTLKPFFTDREVLKEEFFMKRPEVLSVEDFINLTNRIAAIQPPGQ